MTQFPKFILLIFLSAISINGICSDSAYIAIRWNGDIDKPYHEFIFYKKSSPHADQSPVSYSNYIFILKCALSDKDFDDLKLALFAETPDTDSVDSTAFGPKSKSFPSYYFLGYVDNDSLLLGKDLYNKTDLVRTYKKMTRFFKGTEFEPIVKAKWRAVFGRLLMNVN
jgi:hypothetical protein